MPCMQEIIRQNEGALQELFAEINNTPTLAKIMVIAFQIARFLTVAIVEAVLAKRADQTCRWPKCPKCGARIENKDREPRQIRTLLGVVHWKRKVGRCPNKCEIGQIAPLDETLGIEPNQRVCADLKRVACALAVFVPYGIASILLALASKVTVSAMTIWDWAQEAGEESMKSLESELIALQEGGYVEPEEIDAVIAQLPLIIGGDGVFVPLRPNEGSPEGKTEWKEVKVGIFARLKRYTNTKGRSVSKLLQRRLVAVLGDKDEFSLRMELESKKQSIDTAETVVWISDGGRGFWSVFNNLFSGAIGILDFFHAIQNIWKAATAWLDGRTRASRRWFSRERHLLRHGQLDLVLADFEKFLDDSSATDDRWLPVYNCYEYLRNHREHLQYPRFKDTLGLPIGSGMVESACKWLIQQRFKNVGMRWSRRGFNHLLHLRLAWVNGRFDELFGIQ